MREMDTRLVLGGPSDGRRISAGRHDVLELLDPRPDAITGVPDGAVFGVAISTSTYRRQEISAGDTIFSVWIHEDLSPAIAMRLLFDGYRHA